MNIRNLIITLLFTHALNISAQVNGCTDKKANNFNPAATSNDGSCTYNGANISPIVTVTLDDEIKETSGLIAWNNSLWTHNDDTKNKLYAIDTATGSILKSYPLANTINHDWEEISQDVNYVYVGDFGNNGSGNRRDLHILRIEKNSLLIEAPIIDTIYFSYSNQTNFNSSGANNTDFDCEAFLVTADSIYLFTKQWISEKTSIYSLPKYPGNYIAQLQSTINIQGLATGITYLEDKRIAVICGYNKLLQPFFYLLYDFKNNDFANGNKRKITINLPFHQIEGIATTNGLKYYATNESFSALNVAQELHTFDFTNYLANYLSSISTLPTGINNLKNKNSINLFPNPSNDFLHINLPTTIQVGRYGTIYNTTGTNAMKFQLNEIENTINIKPLASGLYFFNIDGQDECYSFIKE